MYRRLLPLTVFSLVLLSGAPALAQEAGQVGLTMGYPSSVGLVWQASRVVAIRPEISLSRASVASSGSGFTLTSSGTSWSVGTAVSALFFVGRWDNLGVYVSPRFSYGKAKSTVDQSDTTTSGSSVSATGSFGGQYAVSHRFGVFGEVGGGYTSQTSNYDSSGSHSQADQHSWSTRTAVGVIFYF